MNRRGFLAGILAAGVAPAVVGSGILMPVRMVQPITDPFEILSLEEYARRAIIKDGGLVQIRPQLNIPHTAAWIEGAMRKLAKAIDDDILMTVYSASSTAFSGSKRGGSGGRVVACEDLIAL